MADLYDKIQKRTQQIKRKTAEDYIAEANAKRGYTVTQIDRDAFIQRIQAKDWSAYFLGKAFYSMYRPSIKATLDLTQVSNLDAEAQGFLFQIIFARDVQGWSCDYLYSIEQAVKEVLCLEADEDDLIIVVKE